MKNYQDTQPTLEQELHAIGYLQQKHKINGTSLHTDKELVERIVQAMRWVKVSKMGLETFNLYISGGEKEARLGKKYWQEINEIEDNYSQADYAMEKGL